MIKSAAKLGINDHNLWGVDSVRVKGVRCKGKELEGDRIVLMGAFAQVVAPVQHIPKLALAGAVKIGDRGIQGIGSAIGGRSLVVPCADGDKGPVAERSTAIIELEHGDHAIIGLYRRIDRFQRDFWVFAGATLAATDINQGQDDQKCGYQEIARLHDVI